MSIEVKIPAVGESISSGVVSVWHKKSGDFVSPGDALFTLETDKVSTEIVAENAGVLETKAAEGQEVKIGEIVAIIEDSKVAPEKAAPAEKKTAVVEKKTKPTGEESKEVPESKQKSTGADVLSPAVRRIVEEEHLEPAKISGTGRDGRLTKGDVLAAHPEEEKEDRDRQAEPGTERFTRKKMSPLRRKIAAQLVMAQQ